MAPAHGSSGELTERSGTAGLVAGAERLPNSFGADPISHHLRYALSLCRAGKSHARQNDHCHYQPENPALSRPCCLPAPTLLKAAQKRLRAKQPTEGIPPDRPAFRQLSSAARSWTGIAFIRRNLGQFYGQGKQASHRLGVKISRLDVA